MTTAGGRRMLTVMEAIEKRRSIRKFRPDPVPQEIINTMLEAARLAPSGSNRQPWRFQIITDATLRDRVNKEAIFGGRPIAEAPVMIVCASELLSYVKGNKVAPSSAVLMAESEDWDSLKEFVSDAQLNTAIAIEHMVLAATAMGLGTCWVQRIRPGQMAKLLGWPRRIVALCLLLAGYPAEEPPPRSRLSLEEILVRPQ